MGSGAARELTSTPTDNPEMDPIESVKLAQALEKMDAKDEEFKQLRDDERRTQLAQAWSDKADEILTHLRTVSRVFIDAHQLTLDMGMDGAGDSTVSWLEQTSMKFPRLNFKMHGSGVMAIADATTLETGTFEDISYPWVEAVCVKWVQYSVDKV